MRKATLRSIEVQNYSGVESINTICTNLTFAGVNTKKVVVTSCGAGDGKTYLSLQMSINLAKRGMRVVFVDVDMRRSFFVKRTSFTTEGDIAGVAHYLAGYCDLEDAIYETNCYGLCVMPGGKDVVAPLPLINSKRFTEMLNVLAEHFDLVILDAPPVGMVIDAAQIARSCDGVILIAQYNKTHKAELADAKRQIESSGCPVLGCIINRATFEGISAKRYYNKYYYSYYNSGYYHKSDKKK